MSTTNDERTFRKATAEEIAFSEAIGAPLTNGMIEVVTNDEQAKYGRVTTMAKMVELLDGQPDPPSIDMAPTGTKEREPMLSDADVERMWNSDMFELGERRGSDGYVTKHDDQLFEDGYRFGVKKCVDRYEDLITTGKLRVVEEVGAPLEQVDMDEWWTCSGCKESFLSYHNPPNYCPGCGNKIKR